MIGPPPPPLPPPFKASNQSNSIQMNANEMPIEIDRSENNGIDNNDDSDGFDSDSGLEVVEEPTLRPSELVRGNHNRTMSTISGEFTKA